MIFKKIKTIDIVLILVIITVIALIAHFTLIARNQFFRFIYPVEAILSKNSINCSANSPNWMRSSIIYSIENNGSLANQLVYITQKGKTYHCESGWKDFPLFSEHINEHTRYRYASLTKPITASLVLKMIDEKKLKLDDHLVKYLPELKHFDDNRIKDIKIENLLTHTSGFDRLKSNDPLFNTNEKPWCPFDLKKLESIRLDHAPSQKYTYDNRNYCLLSVVIERIEKQDFRKVLQDGFILSQQKIQFISGPFLADEVKYDFRNEPIFTDHYTEIFNFDALAPVAGLSGSAKSYAEFIYNHSRQKLSILSNSDIYTNCQLNKINSCFTLGLSRYQLNKNTLQVSWHDGGLPAANSLVILDDKGGVTVWTGNGATPEKTKEYAFFKYLYQALDSFY
ncbi:serine hydrolase domain-containing protein [Acinetobacter bereziniae]|uniref:serine hydrolase domain-containing protein n=1 Tax=Acinetobacter bereziniae TaxID=106648 RepID=UPI00148EF536|nr:serine hydrolase domain-containing protein [Acinetobacter bereziniae]MBJ9901251.1 beta-lactamase family protein [Acinetobacter bereziniae]MCU4319243.1 beta-lactamase family protein [Acinetobacter bereziniae]MCU4597341.1 beta-lactamase family protein [Acinetobacter bereziniae]